MTVICANFAKTSAYGKEQHTKSYHLHQRQGGGGLRQTDTFRDEQARERAEPHGHRFGRVHFPRQENQGTEAVPQGTRAKHRLRRLRVVGDVQQGTAVWNGYRRTDADPLLARQRDQHPQAGGHRPRRHGRFQHFFEK